MGHSTSYQDFAPAGAVESRSLPELQGCAIAATDLHEKQKLQSISVCPGKAASASGNSDMHCVCSTVMQLMLNVPGILVEDA